MEFVSNAWGFLSEALSHQLFMFGDSPITLSQIIAAPLIPGILARLRLDAPVAHQDTQDGL